MSTEAQSEARPAKSKKILLVAVIVVGTIVGGGAGAFVAAPLLAGRPPAAAADTADDDAAEEKRSSGAKKGAKGAPPVVHMVDNMVLNPANSGGARFLLLSVGLGVDDAATSATLLERDPELRDVVLRVMGSHTIEELADIGRRDSLKLELRSAVGERFGAGAAREVYFPQFVIQ